MITVKATSTVSVEMDGKTAKDLTSALEWVLSTRPDGSGGGTVRDSGHGYYIEQLFDALKQRTHA